jgi:hypothetical protein
MRVDNRDGAWHLADPSAKHDHNWRAAGTLQDANGSIHQPLTAYDRWGFRAAESLARAGGQD